MIVTKYVFENVDAVGRIEAAYTYDDEAADKRILSAWINNQGGGTVRFKITRSDGVVFTFDCNPGFQRERAFNNSAPQRLALDLTNPAKPAPVSFEYEVQYPPHS